MHEWSVADSIIRTVINWANENHVEEITKVKVGIPSYSFLEVDILKEAFDTMKKDSVLENAELEINIKEPTFKCKNCGFTFKPSDVRDQLESVRSEFGEEYPLHLMSALAPSFLKCPKCGSHDIIVESQDITIDEIEVKKSGTTETAS
ncbi:hydrogenase maturation nickel metallochaperone HypA [Acidianus sulfidivorans JP7]|uniref:Hydrogenase maturation factor HypA n=1 Tax=Acidianus sulfidivorans JP7 TaxID=619593 RepID=A0A2U9ILC0_9CREN|nr:hydrogenase maturation nickel metallochaperone HypA [Acidianus sulfidivorans]AWR96795.1 hydrogenase maturation nickel metallochaperone HypA [Acidianus sulfidivorans JP7]